MAESNIRRRSIFLSAVDPDSSIHLKMMDEDLFKPTEAGADIPIGAVATGIPFYNLQIRGKLFDSNEIVLEDGTDDSVVALVERKYSTTGYNFNLYSKRRTYSGQEPSDILKYDKRLYAFGKVTESDRTLQVIKEGETEVKYTLEPKGDKYVIKRLGKTVATMSPTEGEFYSLDINQGVDPVLLVCLAAIADEQKKKHLL